MELYKNKVGRKKGTPKTGGRKKGTPNKVTTITKEILNEIADGLRPTLAEDLAQLEPKDRINAWLRLVEFVVPKPQRLDVDLTSNQNLTIEAKLKELAQENEEY